MARGPFYLHGLTLNCYGKVVHIWFSNLTITGSDNGLSPGRRHAIIWTNDVMMLIEPLGTNFNGILIEIRTFSFKKMPLKMATFYLGPIVLFLAWIRKYKKYKVWDEINYLFPNFNCATVEGWEWICNFTSRLPGHVVITYPCWDLS